MAKVVTQAFHYMIEGGIRFGYITTGEAFVFLRIAKDDPSTLHYHLVEPLADINAQNKTFPETQSFLYRTAVAQVMAFSLLALESTPRNQERRTDAKITLPKWDAKPENSEDEMTESELQSPPHSEYKPSTYIEDKQSLHMVLRPRNSAGLAACNPGAKPKRKGKRPDSPDGEFGSSYTPSPNERKGKGKAQPKNQPRGGSSKTGSKSSPTDSDIRPFCSQWCLRGLVQGLNLDHACPNVLDHCLQGFEVNRHQLDCETFLVLLREQLQQTRDENCHPLGKEGARGALFKVTLASHGYTVVAKGTVPVFVEDLRHESQVYRRLMPIQGLCIPVCLGNIDLVYPYYYVVGVRIVHMMFLSWAGEEFLGPDNIPAGRDQHEITQELIFSIRAIHRAGVLHRDVRAPNICWNAEAGRVMLIDFERSELLEVQPPFRPESPNRKGEQWVDARLSEEVRLARSALF